MEFTDIIGVQELFENDDNIDKLLHYVITKGRVFPGYKGTYLYNNIGRAEYIAHILKNSEDGQNEVVGISSHVMGNCFWHVRISANGILKENTDELSKCVFCTSMSDDDESIVPVRLVHADALPCYSPGEPVTMQMAAFPLKISYYPNEEVCDKVHNIGMFMGKQLRLASDRLLNFGGEDCLIKGTVKSIERHKTLTIAGNNAEEREFYYVIIDTQFGELPLCHKIDLVSEEERQFFKEGACVFAYCIISGDVAIENYQEGAVYDEINDLKLIRECLDTKDFSRAVNLFCDDAVYISDGYATRANTSNAVREYLQQVADNIKMDENAVIRTLLVYIEDYQGKNDVNKKYIGHYAVVYCQYIEKGIDSFFIIETDENGKVSELYVSRDSGFKVEPVNCLPEKEESDFTPLCLEHNVGDWLAILQMWNVSDDEYETDNIVWGGMEPDCLYEDRTSNSIIKLQDKNEIFLAFKEKLQELNRQNDNRIEDNKLIFDNGNSGSAITIEVSERQRINKIVVEAYSKYLC